MMEFEFSLQVEGVERARVGIGGWEVFKMFPDGEMGCFRSGIEQGAEGRAAAIHALEIEFEFFTSEDWFVVIPVGR